MKVETDVFVNICDTSELEELIYKVNDVLEVHEYVQAVFQFVIEIS
jgi:hypothetical protein